MQTMYEVYLKFLEFLKEFPEFINRARTNMVGLEQEHIDKFIDDEMKRVIKDNER